MNGRLRIVGQIAGAGVLLMAGGCHLINYLKPDGPLIREMRAARDWAEAPANPNASPANQFDASAVVSRYVSMGSSHRAAEQRLRDEVFECRVAPHEGIMMSTRLMLDRLTICTANRPKSVLLNDSFEVVVASNGDRIAFLTGFVRRSH